MTKIPKLILLIIALTAIFLWLSTAFNSCGNKADDVLTEATEAVDDFEDGIDDFSLDDDEDIFSTDEDDAREIDEVTEEDLNISDVEEEPETDFTSPDPEPEIKPTPRASTTTRSTSSGDYMVIAGNYLVESNARTMIKKLANLGYNAAEVAVFDRSQYHTVVAARFSDYGRALEAESAIKRKGVDCYVKKKQY